MAKKHVIIQTAFLGDNLLAIPLIKHLRKLAPQHEIVYVTRPEFKDFFLRTGLVHQVVGITKDDASSYKSAAKSIGECDWVISPHMSFRSAVLAKRIKAQRRIGFKRKWGFLFYSHTVEREMSLPDSLRQLSLLTVVDTELVKKYSELREVIKTDAAYWADMSELKIPSRVPTWAAMDVDYSRYGEASLAKYQLKGQPIVFMAPGSVWNTKRWTSEGYVRVGQELTSQGFKIVLIGSPDEQSHCEEICKMIANSKNLAGAPSLFELGAMLSKGRILLTNDNGAMHLGATAAIPTVAIFGPTVLDFGYRPWTRKALVVETNGLSCRPCGKHGHDVCPIGTHECMKAVMPEQVLAKARLLL